MNGTSKIIITVGLFSVLFLACVFPLRVFDIQTAGRQCYLWQSEFELKWRHSVEHQLWRESYRHTGDRLLLYKTRLQTFGAGTPFLTDKEVETEEGYIGYQQEIYLNEINWAVSRNMEGELLSADGQIPFYAKVPDYSVISIHPVRIGFMSFLLGTSCYEWTNKHQL
ncbi:MAG TPA: DUF1850 domain-containing protein [Pasteurellaceae bacterium]|nr:DUF1850 domain-containing protein [Pasteurellaceae bacterium]